MENRQPFKSACKKPHLKIKWSLIPNQRNPTGFSKGKIPSLPRTQKIVVVSYAKRKGILQKIAQISRQSPIVFSIIYKPPLSSLPMMIFSPCFQNKRVPMKKQSLLSKRQIQILPLTHKTSRYSFTEVVNVIGLSILSVITRKHFSSHGIIFFRILYCTQSCYSFIYSFPSVFMF